MVARPLRDKLDTGFIDVIVFFFLYRLYLKPAFFRKVNAYV